jgi:lysophospholipase L1-like esterase
VHYAAGRSGRANPVSGIIEVLGMKVAIQPAMFVVLFLAALLSVKLSDAQAAAAGPSAPAGRVVPSPGKWMSPALIADATMCATLKTRPLLKVDITVPPHASDGGWFMVRLAINAEGIQRTESPKWLLDRAPGKAGINKLTLTWDTSSLVAKLPDTPTWFKVELVNQGDRERTIYVDNLRCEALAGTPEAAKPAAKIKIPAAAEPKAEVTTVPGPTPFPEKDQDWPGKGVIRKFGFMVGERKAFWAQRQKDQQAVVFVGDSLTGGWKNLGRDFPKLKVANRGLGGDVSRGVLFRFQEDVLVLHPRAVVICIGNNDLTAMGSPADMLSNLADTVAMAEKSRPGMPVVLCSIPSSANPKAPVKANNRKAMNEGIRKMASEHENMRFCDLFTATANADGSPKPEYFATDKLHLSDAGHAKWAELLAPIFVELKLQ